jgi:hypothetical protein
MCSYRCHWALPLLRFPGVVFMLALARGYVRARARRPVHSADFIQDLGAEAAQHVRMLGEHVDHER